MENLFYVPPRSGNAEYGELHSLGTRLECDPDCLVTPGQAFTVLLQSAQVVNSYSEGFFNRFQPAANDLLIRSSAGLGGETLVERVHFFKNNVPPTRHLDSFLHDVVYVCPDYLPGKRLWIDFQIWEVDKRPEDFAQMQGVVNGLSGAIGATFTVYAPMFAAPVAAASKGVGGLIVGLRDKQVSNDEVINCSLKLGHDNVPIRRGHYVICKDPVDAAQHRLSFASQFRLTAASGDIPTTDYAVLTIVDGVTEAPDYVVKQQLAGILTQLEDTAGTGIAAPLTVLTEALGAYNRVAELQRYQELLEKHRANTISPEESQRLDQLLKKSDLQEFITERPEVRPTSASADPKKAAPKNSPAPAPPNTPPAPTDPATKP